MNCTLRTPYRTNIGRQRCTDARSVGLCTARTARTLREALSGREEPTLHRAVARTSRRMTAVARCHVQNCLDGAQLMIGAHTRRFAAAMSIVLAFAANAAILLQVLAMAESIAGCSAKVARRNGGVADLSFAGTRRKPRVGGSAKDRCSSPASLANAYSHGSLERGADRASCSGPAIAALAMHEDGLRRGLMRVKARHLDGGASRSHGSHRQDGL